MDKLREMGVTDEHVTVISGMPITEAMLGREPQWSNATRFSAGRRALVEGHSSVGIFPAYGTPQLYPIVVNARWIGVPHDCHT